MKKLRICCLLLCILLCSGCAGDKTKKEAAEVKETRAVAEIESAAAEKQAAANEAKTIVIDPGHSAVVAAGEEPVGPGASEYKAADTSGTAGVATGIPEYELTMAVSQKVRSELEAKGYRVLLTHETNDVPASCTQRAEVANQANADAFVRIHANGSEDSGAVGAMTICTTPSSPYAAELYGPSRALSDAIITQLSQETGCENDGVWETDSMSENNWSLVLVTIVEMGYMSNPEEDMLMADEEYRNRLAKGIAKGVEEFLAQ